MKIVDINVFLKAAKIDNLNICRPYIICEDGFSVSVQASEYHYCFPRVNNAEAYEAVELGYASELDELIEEYAEDRGTASTVFGYVPVETVNRLLEKHGGITKIGMNVNGVSIISDLSYLEE